MAIRRGRRIGRPQGRLPLRANHRFGSITCWYCDLKIYMFNELLYFFGRRHARFLQSWMTIGVAFAVICLVGITVILVWEATAAFALHSSSFWLKDISLPWLLGTSELVSNFSISVMDFAVIIFSTILSVTVHELGHAVAAASQGVPIEYIAIFLAVIFPGALVAFDNDLLQALSNIASLRIYCAGIWHNAVFCAVCGLALFLLPFTLHPLYIYGEHPMVLGVSSLSPLSGYLSRGSLILSMDGQNIRSPYELIHKMVQADVRLVHGIRTIRKGYCVPNKWLEESKSIKMPGNEFPCPEGLASFIGYGDLNSNLSLDIILKHHVGYAIDNRCCLNPEQVVKMDKCGEAWGRTEFLSRNFTCSQDDSCMMPLLSPGISWFEISYSNPYSLECLQQRRDMSFVDSSPGYASHPCGIGTFVYVGDKLMMTRSMHLSAYQPRWMIFSWSMDMPTILERMLTCTCNVSAALAAMNCLPIFFLDGEYIIETGLCYITCLTSRRRRKLVQIFLISGTVLSAIAFSRIIYATVHPVAI